MKKFIVTFLKVNEENQFFFSVLVNNNNQSEFLAEVRGSFNDDGFECAPLHPQTRKHLTPSECETLSQAVTSVAEQILDNVQKQKNPLTKMELSIICAIASMTAANATAYKQLVAFS